MSLEHRISRLEAQYEHGDEEPQIHLYWPESEDDTVYAPDGRPLPKAGVIRLKWPEDLVVYLPQKGRTHKPEAPHGGD